MDFTEIINFLQGQFPIAGNILMILGTLVIIATVIDGLIPDEKDHGFMTKILAIPFLGDFLKQVKRFSPFNIKSEEEKKEDKPE